MFISHGDPGEPDIPAVTNTVSRVAALPAKVVLKADGSLPGNSGGYALEMQDGGAVRATAADGYVLSKDERYVTNYVYAHPEEEAVIEEPAGPVAMKEIDLPATPELNADGSLPDSGEGFTGIYVPPTGQIFDVAKPEEKPADTPVAKQEVRLSLDTVVRVSKADVSFTGLAPAKEYTIWLHSDLWKWGALLRTVV
ncbi:hypothetical protein B9G54_01335 [Alloscardovia macacae]|uniref:Uncharacterized protein n=1 Tax=Alloscardovia macacae TaxID=1160091 RepID=A0A1Y2SYX6_9BIFI|nr:hypothetical protein [Alloscardovia macacae]OTA27468.1 hypothetical protein B9G54_01335 [Alloscardovia macacae]OTA28243.1 hypothetical protein B9T39_07150 [Alloscardovia macacae]